MKENPGKFKAVHAKVEIKNLGSHVFWKRTNKILIRFKLSVISIIFVIKTISSLSDKVKFFVINFSSTSTWEDNGYPLSEFNPLTKH